MGRDELEHASLVLADARLVFPAVRADLLGLGHIMFDAHLRQAIVIRLAGFARLAGALESRAGVAGGTMGRSIASISKRCPWPGASASRSRRGPKT